MIKYLKEINVSFHSYELKYKKSYLVVIRNLRLIADTSFIREKLSTNRFIHSNILPVFHKLTNIPLPIIFIDVEPAPSNADIFQITSLWYTKVKVIPSFLKKEIPQRHRCQAYLHNRIYCKHTPQCLQYDDKHESVKCTKDRSTPPQCAFNKGIRATT